VTWTYAAFSNPAAAALARDTVRYHVGDTRADDPLVQDEEIAFALSAASNRPFLAAAIVCESLAAMFARLVDTTSGPQRVAMGSMYDRYDKAATRLRKQDEDATGIDSSGVVIVGPYVAGISRSERITDREDPDLIRPPFGVVGDGPSPFAYPETETLDSEVIP
jgi:hypothetical protein